MDSLTQDFFVSIPEGEPIAGFGEGGETFVGRVIHFLSARLPGVGGADVQPQDLAFVSWLCEYTQRDHERTVVDQWNGCNPLYQPSKPWYDIVEVDRIMGPEVLVPNYMWPTIPHCEAPNQGWKFPFGHADRRGQEGTGSRMYVRHTDLRISASMHPTLPEDCTGPPQQPMSPAVSQGTGRDSFTWVEEDYTDSDS